MITGRRVAIVAGVRAAQFGVIFMLQRAISLASSIVSLYALGPAPGNPIFADWIPRSSMR